MNYTFFFQLKKKENSSPPLLFKFFLFPFSKLEQEIPVYKFVYKYWKFQSIRWNDSNKKLKVVCFTERVKNKAGRSRGNRGNDT